MRPKSHAHKCQGANAAPANYTFSEGGRVGKKKKEDEIGTPDGDQINDAAPTASVLVKTLTPS